MLVSIEKIALRVNTARERERARKKHRETETETEIKILEHILIGKRGGGDGQSCHWPAARRFQFATVLLYIIHQSHHQHSAHVSTGIRRSMPAGFSREVERERARTHVI